MSFIIENELDLLKFTKWVKLNPKCDIVYVYCKSFLEVYYVGYTSQNGLKKINYLNRHRIIPGFKKVFSDSNKIVIYLNYDEDALITFFKPKLNKNSGKDINRRKIRKVNWEEYDMAYESKDFREFLPTYLRNHGEEYGSEYISTAKLFNFYIDIYLFQFKNIDFNLIIKNKWQISQILYNCLPRYHKQVLMYISKNIIYMDEIKCYFFLQKIIEDSTENMKFWV